MWTTQSGLWSCFHPQRMKPQLWLTTSVCSEHTSENSRCSSVQPVHHTSLSSGLRRNKLNQASVKAANDVKKPADAHQHKPTTQTTAANLWVRNPDRWFHVILPRTRHLCVTDHKRGDAESRALAVRGSMIHHVVASNQPSLTLKLPQPPHFLNPERLTSLCHFTVSLLSALEHQQRQTFFIYTSSVCSSECCSTLMPSDSLTFHQELWTFCTKSLEVVTQQKQQ